MNLSRYRAHLCWLVPLVIFDVFFFAWLWKRFSPPSPPKEENPSVAENIHLAFVSPTDRELDRTNPENFQPTASGRIESAFYGSVRTAMKGGQMRPSFHEGIDIAPLERDRAGCPRDSVFAAAAGEVAYANRVAGNSNYGKYVVLLHGRPPDRIYTLYAHLDEISPGIGPGAPVRPGDVLGIMGATSNGRIPAANAHLHFEIGLLLNSRFDKWFKRQKLVPDHGIFNGWNLIGVDPLAVYESQANEGGNAYDLYAHLAAIPRAFELVLKTPHQLDFFRRYPALWQDMEFRGGVMVIACSENGLPLSGRRATAEEKKRLGRKKHTVLGVDRVALGRNGCRLVVNGGGRWRLGHEGLKWLAMLVF